MSEGSISKIEVLETLPAEWEEDLLPEVIKGKK